MMELVNVWKCKICNLVTVVMKTVINFFFSVYKFFLENCGVNGTLRVIFPNEYEKIFKSSHNPSLKEAQLIFHLIHIQKLYKLSPINFL